MSAERTVLVTGSNGIVGRAVHDRLVGAGHRVISIVHRRRDAASPDAITADLTELTAGELDARVSGAIDRVVHLAAAVPHSPENPDEPETGRRTIRMDRCVAGYAERRGLPVVYMSTCGLYDRTVREAKSENAPLHPRTPYFKAKAEGERLFRDLGATILRLAAPIGPGVPEGLVVRRFLDAAGRDEVLGVWGEGTREQNFIDVRDVAQLVGRAVDRSIDATMNAASPSATSMLELARTVVEVVGHGRVEFTGRPDPLDGEFARYDVSAAELLLGWTPEFVLADSLRHLAMSLNLIEA